MHKHLEFLPGPFPGEPKDEFFSTEKMRNQVYKSIATTYEGKPCHHQPKDGEIPELDVGTKGNGCQVKTYSPNFHPKNEGQLDIPDLYKKADQENVQLKAEEVPIKGRGLPGVGLGSGAIVGRKGDEILVMTDNHVIAPHPGRRTVSIEARFGDGQIYSGRIVARDLKNDTDIIAFKTGANTDKEYHPATFQDGWSELKRGQKYLTTGYPEATSRLHVSPGELVGLDHSSRAGFEKRLPGEDHNRFWGMLKSHTREGNSGGPTYSGQGDVVGTLEGGVHGDTRISFINPISRQYVAKLLKQAGADPEK